MSPRNIVVCADGTGNKGGYSPDSNVYTVYKSVANKFSGVCKDGVDVDKQLVFYDNGVGTSTNKYLRAITGGVGFGFKKNICDAYKFLARNYREGDRVFFFGFSRGASTIRACNGMISKCGLANGHNLRNAELDDLVAEAYEAYQNHKKKPDIAKDFKNNPEKSLGAVPIKFLGVWDTVVALGFPKRTVISGPFTLFLNITFGILEPVFDKIFKHSFYYYKLTDNVKHACQALAIDDERTAFWPHVWQEKNIEGAKDRTNENVEQVWFAGMHSNVGGGYERSGISGVPLYWMMTRAQHHGLVFKPGAMQRAFSSSHVHGTMYDSRAGLNMIYRYLPRDIEARCKDRMLDDRIKIHHSVIERINYRTENYKPNHIPVDFDVVDNEMPANRQRLDLSVSTAWKAASDKINTIVKFRQVMYDLSMTFLLSAIIYTVYFWQRSPGKVEYDGALMNFAVKLDSYLPDMFKGLFEFIIVQNTAVLIAVTIFLVLFIITLITNKLTDSVSEDLRHEIVGKKMKDVKQVYTE